MSTQSSIEYISRMLEEPQNLSAADVDSIRSITESYPYFVPARYMQAGEEHKQDPFSSTMMSMMQLYMGNWLLFYKFLEKASEGQPAPSPKKEKEKETATPPSPAIKSEFDADAAPQAAGSMDEGYPESMWEEEVETDTTATVNIEQEEEAEHIEVEQEEDTGWEDEVTAEEEQEDEYIETVRSNYREPEKPEDDESLILPVYTEDYFRHQGINVSNDIPNVNSKSGKIAGKEADDKDKSLMVIMSFSEWLMHFKTKKQEEEEEQQGQRSVKSMWQRQKLAAALEEEDDEIPEQVFEMAVNSITKEEDLASESLAEIFIIQGKYDKAIDMYRKLSLRNPQKNAYFARKIEELQKKAKT